ncbi:MAG: hypothetical protein ACLTQI_05915 [Slackia sp.]
MRSIGKWFFLQNFDSIYEWRGGKKALVDRLLGKSNGKGRSGTNTSVNEALRLRDMGASGEALGILFRHPRNLLHRIPGVFQGTVGSFDDALQVSRENGSLARARNRERSTVTPRKMAGCPSCKEQGA